MNSPAADFAKRERHKQSERARQLAVLLNKHGILAEVMAIHRGQNDGI